MAAPEGSLAVNDSTVEQQIAAPSASFNMICTDYSQESNIQLMCSCTL
jgi:hypothetical protein